MFMASEVFVSQSAESASFKTVSSCWRLAAIVRVVFVLRCFMMENRKKAEGKQEIPPEQRSIDHLNNDPVREKLKQWQINRGRTKENFLPWQKRVVKKTEEGAVETEKTRNPLARLENKLKQDGKVEDRRQQLEKWLEEKKAGRSTSLKRSTSRDSKLDSRINCTSSTTTTNSQKEAKSSKPAVKCAKVQEKPAINFVQWNKMNVKMAAEKLKRRTTVADVHIKSRRRSIDKIKRHSVTQNPKYYCYKRSNKKSNNLNKKIEDKKENGRVAGKRNEKIDVGQEMKNSSSHQKEPIVEDSLPEDETSDLVQFISPRVKFVLSPIHQLSHLNVYTVTPVRRSLRMSSTPSNQRHRRVIDSMDMIPNEIRNNVIYKSNPALDLIK